jgi:hypothetical protein
MLFLKLICLFVQALFLQVNVKLKLDQFRMRDEAGAPRFTGRNEGLL